MLSQLLARLHIPGNVAETIVDRYRRAAGASSGRASRAPAIPLEQLPREIVDAPVSSFRVPQDAWAVGKTLQELDLRNSTGATVLAIRRSGRTTTSPSGSFTLDGGDDMFLLGDDSDILLARALVTDGPRQRISRQG